MNYNFKTIFTQDPNKNIIVFDFDGVLSTPVFSPYKGKVMEHKNNFEENYKIIDKSYKEWGKPVHGMQELVEALFNTGYELRVLSSCSRGSKEIFAKIDFLNKYYPGCFLKDNFYGVFNTEQKKLILKQWIDNEIKHDNKNIFYVDDNLEMLIDIEAELSPLLSELTSNNLYFYHNTTFITELLSKEEINMFKYYFEGTTGYVKANTKEEAFEKVVKYYEKFGHYSRKYFEEYLRLSKESPLIIE